MSGSPPPSTASIAVASALIAGVTGYFIGQAKQLGIFGGSPITVSKASDKKKDEDSDEEYEDSSDDEATDLSEFPGHNEECKLVLVVRTDLGMTKGTRARLKLCGGSFTDRL
jgi:hypothetical protein